MWKETNEGLEAEFEFEDFVEACSFMTRVASVAEEQQHHPEWFNVYNKVRIRLRTHDANNNITEKDRRLAAAIDALWACN